MNRPAATTIFLLAALLLPKHLAAQGETTRVSVRDLGLQVPGRAIYASISGDGRFVAFQSLSTGLLPIDTHGAWQVYRRDRVTGEVVLVSIDPTGEAGTSSSNAPALSADGRFVAFASLSTTLVPGDTNGTSDVFVRDLALGTTTRVSVDSSGNESTGSAGSASLSPDGRFVVFTSNGGDLVSGDTNAVADVFVHDRLTGATERVSVTSSGGEGNGHSSSASNGAVISADGRYVSLTSDATDLVPGDTNARDDVFVHDRQTGETRRVSVSSSGMQGSSYSRRPAISIEGRYVTFESDAPELVAGDTNGVLDVFVHDLQTAVTSRVSVTSNAGRTSGRSFDASISADGRYVAFESEATDLVAGDTNGVTDAFVHDRQTGTTTRVSVGPAAIQGDGLSASPQISADGSCVAFHGRATNFVTPDLNPQDDVFVRELVAGVTTLECVSGRGLQLALESDSPSISADGRYVVFTTRSPDVVPDDTNNAHDVFCHDRWTGRTQRVSVDSQGVGGDGFSNDGRISGDGRYIAFVSAATNFVPGDNNGLWDIFVHDRLTGMTDRVAESFTGTSPDAFSARPAISNHGRFVAFETSATNIVPGDTNGAQDVFVRDRLTGITTCVSVSMSGGPADGWSFWSSLSGDGRYVAFSSDATNIVPGDTNGLLDVFVRDLHTGVTTRVSTSASGAEANGESSRARISPDGAFVAFDTAATNLVPIDVNGTALDVVVKELSTGSIVRASLGAAGSQVLEECELGSISRDGRFVTFMSWSSNLVLGDTNGAYDIFLRDLAAGTTELVSLTGADGPANHVSGLNHVTHDGRAIAFVSVASNLVAHDTNGEDDIFVRDRTPLAPRPFCYGDGSATPCPCNNTGALGRGCASSSFAGGARLAGDGSSSLANDTLVLHVDGSTPNNPGMFFQGNHAVNATFGVPFGDGLRCAGNQVVRIQVLVANAAGEASTTFSIATQANLSPGDVKRYQWWYRDPLPSSCGAGFNYSNGLEVVWRP